MQKTILIQENINVFGFEFQKDSKVYLNGDYISITYTEGDQSCNIPFICSKYGRTSEEFIKNLNEFNTLWELKLAVSEERYEDAANLKSILEQNKLKIKKNGKI
jgi:hypothetical protein